MLLDTSLINTQQYSVRIKDKVEQSRERSRVLLYISVLELLQKELSGRPRLRSPTIHYTTHFLTVNITLQMHYMDTACQTLLYGCTTWTLTKRIEEKLACIAEECYQLYWTNPGSNIPQKSCSITYLQSLKLSKKDGQDMWDTAEEVRINS